MKQSTALNSTYNAFRNRRKVENGSTFMCNSTFCSQFLSAYPLYTAGYCYKIYLFLKRNRNMLTFISKYKAEVLKAIF